mmetsp:Transcript_34551/g.56677  ORF Transcript_34551/g.56677 Transcript_34551/m.56677 type:complete len:209 (-) Transcript_34551:807-1433(-)
MFSQFISYFLSSISDFCFRVSLFVSPRPAAHRTGRQPAGAAGRGDAHDHPHHHRPPDRDRDQGLQLPAEAAGRRGLQPAEPEGGVPTGHGESLRPRRVAGAAPSGRRRGGLPHPAVRAQRGGGGRRRDGGAAGAPPAGGGAGRRPRGAGLPGGRPGGAVPARGRGRVGHDRHRGAHGHVPQPGAQGFGRGDPAHHGLLRRGRERHDRL